MEAFQGMGREGDGGEPRSWQAQGDERKQDPELTPDRNPCPLGLA